MYQFETTVGASPPAATVKAAPVESKVGLFWLVNSFEDPLVKSTYIDLPSAGSAGQLDCTKGSHLLHVCWDEGCTKRRAVMVAIVASRRGELIASKSLSSMLVIAALVVSMLCVFCTSYHSKSAVDGSKERGKTALSLCEEGEGGKQRSVYLTCL